MNKIVHKMKQFLNDEEGVTAIEYALIAALIGVVIIGSTQIVGTSLVAVFGAVSAALLNAI